MAASPLCQPPDRTLILWTHKGGDTMKRSLGTTLAGAALILTLGACSSTPPLRRSRRPFPVLQLRLTTNVSPTTLPRRP